MDRLSVFVIELVELNQHRLLGPIELVEAESSYRKLAHQTLVWAFNILLAAFTKCGSASPELCIKWLVAALVSGERIRTQHHRLGSLDSDAHNRFQ